MVEFQKQVAKEGAQSANAEYYGLADKPLTGEKNGKTWTKFKLKFKLEGKDNENKFILWTPIKSDKSKYKNIEELTQFDKYHLVWYEEEKEYNDKEWVEKTIQIINDYSETAGAVSNAVTPKSGSAPTPQPKKEKFTEERIKALLDDVEKTNKAKNKEKNNTSYLAILAKLFTMLHPEEWEALHESVMKFIKEHKEPVKEEDDKPTERKELNEEVVKDE